MMHCFNTLRKIRHAAFVLCVLGCCLSVSGQPLHAAAADPFPETALATRHQALTFIAGGATATERCLTPEIQRLRQSLVLHEPGTRRTLAPLRRRITLTDEQILRTADGTTIHFTTTSSSLNRLDPADLDGDGSPDLVQAVLSGLEQARALFTDQLGFPAQTGLEITIADLGGSLDSYLMRMPLSAAQLRIVLDASPTDGANTLRRATIHQYAHAVALTAGGRFPSGWGEALAMWAVLEIDAGPDQVSTDVFSTRLGRLSEGLMAGESTLAAGNALWFAFLDEAYGLAAVQSTIRQLATTASLTEALDLAVRQSTSDDLPAAFREFHLWALLVGDRSDGRHFSFAEQLAAPAFAANSDGIPTLSIQADPPIAPLGATQVALTPEHADGGITVRFEGEFSIAWGVDLVLLKRDGTKHRLAMPLSEGSGERTLPLHDLDRVWLLIRNLDSSSPANYSYTAYREKGFPFDLTAFEAFASDDGGTIQINWETASESRLFGYNLLRTREDGEMALIVNPVWIPGLGNPTAPTSYRFNDTSVEAGTGYTYRLQGITKDGLATLSSPVAVQPNHHSR
jgi:hypothetical protein